MKYCNGSEIIEAFMLNEKGTVGIGWFWDAVLDQKIITHNFGKSYAESVWCEIETLNGVAIAETGDYIIRETTGEIYPCKSGVFEKTFSAL